MFSLNKGNRATVYDYPMKLPPMKLHTYKIAYIELLIY